MSKTLLAAASDLAVAWPDMTTVSDLLAHINRTAPFASAADWDPVGLQIGDPAQSVSRVAVCHEVTPAVIDRLEGDRVGAVVSYHPLLFEPTRQLLAGDSAEGRALRLAAMETSLVVVHTAFDVADGGTADALSDALGLSDVRPLSLETDSADDPGVAIGRLGESTESLSRLAKLAAGALGVTPRVARAINAQPDAEGPEAGNMTVAVVPGSGSSFIEVAAKQGADVLVTGDVSHHRAQTARVLGISIIDAGHVPTERPGLARLVELVSEAADVVDLTDLDPHPWEDADG